MSYDQSYEAGVKAVYARENANGSFDTSSSAHYGDPKPDQGPELCVEGPKAKVLDYAKTHWNASSPFFKWEKCYMPGPSPYSGITWTDPIIVGSFM